MESKKQKVWRVAKTLSFVIFAVLLGMNAAFWLIGFGQTERASELQRKDNQVREKQLAATVAQNELLRSLRLCTSPTPYPQPNPDDPICGNPAALKPTPEVHAHGQ